MELKAQVAAATLFLRNHSRNKSDDPWMIHDNFRVNYPSIEKVELLCHENEEVDDI